MPFFFAPACQPLLRFERLPLRRRPLSHLYPAAARPDPPPWLPPALHAAACSRDPRAARRAHALALTSGLARRPFYANNFITLYSKCGSIPTARYLFNEMPQRDTVSWNSLLSAYALHGLFLDALRLFRLMLCSAVPLTALSFTPVLKLCSASVESLAASQAIHCCSVRCGLDSDSMVSSALVNLYCKLGLIDDARHLFDGMVDRDVVLWNIMIKGYMQMGLAQEAFSMFVGLHQTGMLRPDKISVHCLLTGEKNSNVEQVQAYGVKSCLFDDRRDVVTWNKTMSEHAKAGEIGDVLSCFVEMKRLDVDNDNVTFVIVLTVFTEKVYLKLGAQIHAVAMKGGFDSDISVSNSLANMYAKMGSSDCAMRVFEEMQEWDLISWNSMISNSTKSGSEEESVTLFLDMLRHGVIPDQFTLASILRACSGIPQDAYLHEQVHSCAIKLGLLTDTFVQTALVDVYAKKGSMKEAEFLLKGMDAFDLASYNALIAGYVTNNDSKKALDLFLLVQRTGLKSNHFTIASALKACSTMVAFEQGKQIHAQAIKNGFDSELCVSSGILDMYLKCGSITDASAVFSDISDPDDVAWTAMISGCVENGDEHYALKLYHQMRQSGALSDEFILASLIKACSCLAALEQGRQIHANAIKLDLALDAFVGTSLMDMYSKCGNVEDSYELFRRMDVKTLASWNTMFLGFAQHGNGKVALDLFKKMKFQGLKPDKISFIGVLSACSHSGLVSEAYSYFDSMQNVYGIKPEIEHYSCLVDVLGRGGFLGEAEKVMEMMPFDASASMYRALLGACRTRGNMEIGRRVATRLLSLEPQDSSAYVLLSNIYAAANQWDEVLDSRKRMKSRKVKKDPGYSWIEVKNKVHLFVVDDKSHPEAAAIYIELEDLIRRIKHEGYVPDTDFVLLDVEEEEKERALYYHSEKLAIAYGLISTTPPMRIRVIKNLRVCGDCHNAIKYISWVVGREIVLRDANRFHCFRGGTCTCGDYW